METSSVVQSMLEGSTLIRIRWKALGSFRSAHIWYAQTSCCSKHNHGEVYGCSDRVGKRIESHRNQMEGMGRFGSAASAHMWYTQTSCCSKHNHGEIFGCSDSAEKRWSNLTLIRWKACDALVVPICNIAKPIVARNRIMENPLVVQSVLHGEGDRIQCSSFPCCGKRSPCCVGAKCISFYRFMFNLFDFPCFCAYFSRKQNQIVSDRISTESDWRLWMLWYCSYIICTNQVLLETQSRRTFWLFRPCWRGESNFTGIRWKGWDVFVVLIYSLRANQLLPETQSWRNLWLFKPCWGKGSNLTGIRWKVWDALVLVLMYNMLRTVAARNKIMENSLIFETVLGGLWDITRIRWNACDALVVHIYTMLKPIAARNRIIEKSLVVQTVLGGSNITELRWNALDALVVLI